MERVPKAEEQIRFLLNIQRLLSEGQFTATYKFALLLAIADICVEKGNDGGEEFLVHVDDLAEKFIAYYWRQSNLFNGFILKQNTGAQAAVISKILETKNIVGGSLFRLKFDKQKWQTLRNEVANIIAVMPLWKLQTVGKQQFEFLYGNTGKGKQIILKCIFRSKVNRLFASFGSTVSLQNEHRFAASGRSAFLVQTSYFLQTSTL